MRTVESLRYATLARVRNAMGIGHAVWYAYDGRRRGKPAWWVSQFLLWARQLVIVRTEIPVNFLLDTRL